MTPAEWLAALLLVWVIVGSVWKDVFSPVTTKYNNPVYVFITFCVEVTLVVLACHVLAINAAVAVSVALGLLLIGGIGAAGKGEL